MKTSHRTGALVMDAGHDRPVDRFCIMLAGQDTACTSR